MQEYCNDIYVMAFWSNKSQDAEINTCSFCKHLPYLCSEIVHCMRVFNGRFTSYHNDHKPHLYQTDRSIINDFIKGNLFD